MIKSACGDALRVRKKGVFETGFWSWSGRLVIKKLRGLLNYEFFFWKILTLLYFFLSSKIDEYTTKAFSAFFAPIKMTTDTRDLEHSVSEKEKETMEHNVEEGKGEQDAKTYTKGGRWRHIVKMLEKRGDVEVRGATPVPADMRNETKYFNIFTLWFCVSCNPLPYVYFLL